MKYIDADRLKEEFQKRFDICKRVSDDDRNTLDTQDWYRGKYTAYSECLSFIVSLQQEQPEEICSKCIHHGKDDDYCYYPHGGMQSLINENGIYECTGFYEKEQEQPEVDLEKGCSNALIRPLTIKATMKKSEREGYYAVHSDCKIGNSYLSGYGVTQKRAREDFEESIREAMFENVNIEYHE